MKKAIKNKWVKALRGGKYTQTTGVLYGEEYNEDYDEEGECIGGETIDTHCCLGVLCEIAGKPREVWQNEGLLPDDYLTEFGLTAEQQEKLAAFNDEKKWSFKKIASYIERYL